MKITMKKWIADIKQSGKRTAIPILTHPCIDMTGKLVYDAVMDGSIHFEALTALNKKFPLLNQQLLRRL